MKNELSAGCFAAAAAALFVSACGGSSPPATDAASASADEVKCLGIHECKGKSQCGVEGAHSCAGQNECKGKGWIKVSQAECETKGGKVL